MCSGKSLTSSAKEAISGRGRSASPGSRCWLGCATRPAIGWCSDRTWRSCWPKRRCGMSRAWLGSVRRWNRACEKLEPSQRKLLLAAYAAACPRAGGRCPQWTLGGRVLPVAVSHAAAVARLHPARTGRGGSTMTIQPDFETLVNRYMDGIADGRGRAVCLNELLRTDADGPPGLRRSAQSRCSSGGPRGRGDVRAAGFLAGRAGTCCRTDLQVRPGPGRTWRSVLLCVQPQLRRMWLAGGVVAAGLLVAVPLATFVVTLVESLRRPRQPSQGSPGSRKRSGPRGPVRRSWAMAWEQNRFASSRARSRSPSTRVWS